MLFHTLFHPRRVQFAKADPLGDGLGDEIVSEQLEPEAITLDEGVNPGELSEFWQSVESDIEQDPEWFHFTEE